MWFAALGSYHHNPWLISLMYRLLHSQNKIRQGDGSSRMTDNAVLDLLDRDQYPFEYSPPSQVRAVLYDYDFTRWNTSWNRMTVDSEDDLILYGRKQGESAPKWWIRRNGREYLPALDAKNPSLKEFIVQSGRHRSLANINDKSAADKYTECVKLCNRGSDRLRYFLESHLSYSLVLLSTHLPVYYSYQIQLWFDAFLEFVSGTANPLKLVCGSVMMRDYISRAPVQTFQKLVTPAAGDVVISGISAVLIGSCIVLVMRRRPHKNTVDL
jgi:hypothetical protein